MFHKLFLNETIPNIKIPNQDWRQNPKCKNPNTVVFWEAASPLPPSLAKLGEGQKASSPSPSLAGGGEKAHLNYPYKFLRC
jgi:hypothetical protein